ncbi:Structural maintenance of chromosomes protein 2-1 [Glycine soja]
MLCLKRKILPYTVPSKPSSQFLAFACVREVDDNTDFAASADGEGGGGSAIRSPMVAASRRLRDLQSSTVWFRRFSTDSATTLGFFKWAKSQTGYRHSPELYYLMVDVLGKCKSFDSMSELVEEMARLEGYVTLETMTKVMRRMSLQLYTFKHSSLQLQLLNFILIWKNESYSIEDQYYGGMKSLSEKVDALSQNLVRETSVLNNKEDTLRSEEANKANLVKNIEELKHSGKEKSSAVKKAEEGAADLKKKVDELTKSLEEHDKEYQVKA